MAPQTKEALVDIAIVGGGFAGLATAIGLQKYGHLNVHVYEAASKFSEIGSGIVMGPNAQHAMDIIDPAIKIGFEKRAVFDPDTPDINGMYKWFSMRKGQEPDLNERVALFKHSIRPSAIHRADLLDELVKLVDPSKCHFGMRLEAVYETDDPDSKIALSFRNGSVAKADIVIGADGIHSILRKHILGANDPAAEAMFTGTVVYRALVPLEDVKAKLGHIPTGVDAICGDGGHIIHFPVSGGQRYFLGVTVHHIQEWTHDHHAEGTDLGAVKAKFAAWGDEGRKLAELLPEGKTEAWAIHDMCPASTYYKGRCVMLGDAAHASSPHQGSGASSAIEDAAVLGKLLGELLDPRERAKASAVPLSTNTSLMLQAYDTVRRFRSQKIVYTSRRSGRIMGGIQPGVGKTAAEIKTALDGMPDWIWDHDQDMQVRDAFELYESARRGLTRNIDI